MEVHGWSEAPRSSLGSDRGCAPRSRDATRTLRKHRQRLTNVAHIGVATVGLRGNLRTFHGLSTTFSGPILAMMYHIRQCSSYHMKTIIA